MEQKYFIKLRNLYIVLYNCEIIEEEYFFDLCLNKKHATKFTFEMVQDFAVKWKFLMGYNIRFQIEQI